MQAIELNPSNSLVAALREATGQIEWCVCDGITEAYQKGNAWICDLCGKVQQVG